MPPPLVKIGLKEKENFVHMKKKENIYIFFFFFRVRYIFEKNGLSESTFRYFVGNFTLQKRSREIKAMRYNALKSSSNRGHHNNRSQCRRANPCQVREVGYME